MKKVFLLTLIGLTGCETYIPAQDVYYDASRESWFDKSVFNPQPYMRYGILTDEALHPLREKQPISNCYAAGSILSGYNPLEEGCGSGVAILTAFDVSDKILSSK